MCLWKPLLAKPEGSEGLWQEQRGCPPRLCAEESRVHLGPQEGWQPRFHPKGRAWEADVAGNVCRGCLCPERLSNHLLLLLLPATTLACVGTEPTTVG